MFFAGIMTFVGVVAGVSVAWRRRANRKESQNLHFLSPSNGQRA
jgi:hypothetical protein